MKTEKLLAIVIVALIIAMLSWGAFEYEVGYNHGYADAPRYTIPSKGHANIIVNGFQCGEYTYEYTNGTVKIYCPTMPLNGTIETTFSNATANDTITVTWP